MSFAVNGTTGITFNDNTNMATAASLGPRNRIISGNMAIDQRNVGAAINSAATGSFPVDRFVYYTSQTGKFNLQQNAGSVTSAAGFTNYLGCTSTSSYSSLSSDVFVLDQKIEGYNVADLNWGTANAKTVTLSFWVYSSLTGTFGGSFQNSVQNRAYSFSYTISSANTWTYITITIAGDTSGTWITNNGVGIIINWDLGCGSTYRGAAGSWSGSNYLGATGAVSVVGTSGATFYITGVQLEVGSVATPYQFNTYSDQLAQCQRYFSKSYDLGYATGSITGAGVFGFRGIQTVYNEFPVSAPIAMRATPTLTFYSPNSGASGKYYNYSASADVAASSDFLSQNTFTFSSGTGVTANQLCGFQWTLSAEL